MSNESQDDSRKLSWTQPICEKCWIDVEGVWDDQFPNVLLNLRLPVSVTLPVIEQCAWCGDITIFGVYKRVDPTTVRYPREDNDE